MVDLSAEAFRHWVHALCYCSEHGTGGHLDAAIRALRVPPAVVKALVKRELWEVDEDGHWVHDWAIHNEKRDASTDARREADRERQRRHRQAVKARKAAEDAKRVTNASRDEPVTALRDSHRDASRARAGGRPNVHDHVQDHEDLEPSSVRPSEAQDVGRTDGDSLDDPEPAPAEDDPEPQPSNGTAVELLNRLMEEAGT